MNQVVELRTQDVGLILDYLEGLVAVLADFHDDGVGRSGAGEHPLVSRLRDLHGFSAGTWEALRYQSATGQGWQDVASGVEQLRERLLGPYTDAAL